MDEVARPVEMRFLPAYCCVVSATPGRGALAVTLEAVKSEIGEAGT
jgi:hypothetical protein